MTRLIRELTRPYHRFLALILMTSLIQVLMSLAGPWPLKIVVDNVAGTHPPPHWINGLLPLLGGSSKLHLAAFAAILTITITVLSVLAIYVSNYYTQSVGQWVAKDLRLRAYHHLQRLSLSYYDTHQVGTILSTMTDDVGTLQNFASQSILGMVVDALTIVGMIGVMFWLRWDFALIAIAVTPFLALFVARIRKVMKTAIHEMRKRQADIVDSLQESLGEVRVVQAFNRQDLKEQELQQVSKASVQAALKAWRVILVLSPAATIAIAVCTGLLLWRGSYLILTNAMTLGALTVFIGYLNRFFQPVQDFATLSNSIAGASVAADRIRAILDTDTVIPERPDATDPPPFRGDITFEHVAFDYDPASPVLRDVNFSIKPGQTVGVVGPTGTGKTTVASLIPRFYDVTAGTIKIDGVDVRDYKLYGLRDHIGFVLQDTVLFTGTVRDNIAFGRPGATEDEIIQAAKLANADEFITRMPHGYDSFVGERGCTLSGGERQRIGIARALIRDSALMILDEPTASLDVESEHLVVEALERLMRGRTVIIIAHRLSTIRNADNIIALKDGVVAEQGTHEQLLALDGIYAELHRIQLKKRLGAIEPGAFPA